MRIKAFIADIDGTLLDHNKVLTPRSREAVDELRAAGIQFTVTSGRPPRGIASLIRALDLTAPIAAFNGGMFVKPDLKTVLVLRTIPPDVARLAVDHLLGAGLDVWVYQSVDWFITRADAPRVDIERRNVGFDPVVIPDLHAVLDDAVKIVGVSLDHPLVARAEAELRARLGARASASRSQPHYLDVTHPEANKGMVVRGAARILRIRTDQIATIGDMPNDIPMLTAAGLGIAMGNASPDVQRFARHVTRTNDEDGFAHAVDTFVLGAPPFSGTALGLPPRVRACLFSFDGRDAGEAYGRSLRYIEAARAAGLMTALVSSRDDSADAARAAGLADLFDVLVDGRFAAAHRLEAKPAPDLYRAAAAELGVDCDHTAIFDDGPAGIEAGKVGHFGYIVALERLGAEGELRGHAADAVVGDLTDLMEPEGQRGGAPLAHV